jgi:hypothetical protein
MCILLINEPSNPGRHLERLDNMIKSRKFKASQDEIKLILMGFDGYQGVLKFGLSTPLENNRIAALEILVDLLLPERNLLFEKYERALEKVPVEEWTVEDLNYLESPLFKVLYFRLLSIYCERVDKDQQRGEAVVLKSLFNFHENLMSDYFHWKKMNREGKIRRRTNSRSMPEQNSPTQTKKQEAQLDSLEVVDAGEEGVAIYYWQPKNTLVFKLDSLQSPEQLQQAAFKWHRFIESY